jgi:hypothetical protein
MRARTTTETILDQESLHEFVRGLFDSTPDHEQWLIVARYGREYLVEHPLFLLEVCAKEAIRIESDLHGDNGINQFKTTERLAHILLDELELRIEV